MATRTLMVVLALGACTEVPTQTPNGPVAQVFGVLEPGSVDDEQRIRWNGSHQVRVTVDDRLLCDGLWDVQAVERRVAECTDCEMALELQGTQLVLDDCAAVFDEPLESAPPFLAYVPTVDRTGIEHGRILAADAVDGPWRTWGSAVFDEDGSMVYQRGYTTQGGYDLPSDVDEPSLRALNGPPLTY